MRVARSGAAPAVVVPPRVQPAPRANEAGHTATIVVDGAGMSATPRGRAGVVPLSRTVAALLAPPPGIAANATDRSIEILEYLSQELMTTLMLDDEMAAAATQMIQEELAYQRMAAAYAVAEAVATPDETRLPEEEPGQEGR